MLRKSVVKCCLLGTMAIMMSACSSTKPRYVESINTTVVTPPPKPVIQRHIVPKKPDTNNNQGAYRQPEFEAYKPESSGPYASTTEPYESYTPKAPTYDTYTTPLEPSPPVVIERLSPEPIIVEEIFIASDFPVTPAAEEAPAKKVVIDPFADIPDRATTATNQSRYTPIKPAPVRSQKSLSAAANALLNAAKSDAAASRYDSAITKVERALRIEPDSPMLWYQLANLNYGKGRYDQAISLSRKSLRMSAGNKILVSQNLDLMSKAATKAGDTHAFKEVIDYKKNNT